MAYCGEAPRTYGITPHVQWFIDTFTGKDLERPALDEMFAALDSNGVRIVLVERLDRLARKVTVQEGIIAKIQLSGFTLISIAEPELIPQDEDILDAAMRVAVRQVMGVFAELDRAMMR